MHGYRITDLRLRIIRIIHHHPPPRIPPGPRTRLSVSRAPPSPGRIAVRRVPPCAIPRIATRRTALAVVWGSDPESWNSTATATPRWICKRRRWPVGREVRCPCRDGGGRRWGGTIVADPSSPSSRRSCLAWRTHPRHCRRGRIRRHRRRRCRHFEFLLPLERFSCQFNPNRNPNKPKSQHARRT